MEWKLDVGEMSSLREGVETPILRGVVPHSVKDPPGGMEIEDGSEFLPEQYRGRVLSRKRSEENQEEL